MTAQVVNLDQFLAAIQPNAKKADLKKQLKRINKTRKLAGLKEISLDELKLRMK